MNVSNERLDELASMLTQLHGLIAGIGAGIGIKERLTDELLEAAESLRELRALRERHKEAIKLLTELEANPSIEAFRRTARFLSNEIDPFTGARP